MIKKAVIIFIHLLLLFWIIYVLYAGGSLSTTSMMLHFTGMALYGSLLIRGTAFIVKKDYEKSVRK